MKTLILLLTALFTARPVLARTALGDIQAFAPGISSAETAAALPEAKPYPADLRDSLADSGDIDTEKAGLLARLSLKHLGRNFGGRCYQAVWYDVLIEAGFPDDNNVPAGSAYKFAEYAKENPAWLKDFKLKIIPTPDTMEAMPAGSIVVYDPGQEDPYGRAHPVHGHIEVIADKDGARYGCSDACADIGDTGAFLAKPAAKEHVTVFVPIK
ncbi:MAG: hypothetical protein PHV36_10755 [Elusimicrobiales bacterium]|nr:hypothetical protein [Elusimicrobiales bacterium]